MSQINFEHSGHTWTYFFGSYNKSMRVLPYDIILPPVLSKDKKFQSYTAIVKDATVNPERFEIATGDKPYVVAAPNGYGSDIRPYTVSRIEAENGMGRCELLRCTTGWVPSGVSNSGHVSKRTISLVSRLPKNAHFAKPLPLP